MTAIARLNQHFGPDLGTRLEALLAAEDALWVTDADGTLWSDDIGEGFLRQLIADKALVSPEAEGVDVWKSYEERVAQDRAAGYAWAVQVMAGMLEEDVQHRADAFAQSFVPRHVHPEMRAMVEASHQRGFALWIVSASSKWIVTAAARVLGLPVERAIGITVAVRDGRLTTDIVPPITYRAGKVEAIRKLIGRIPTLASGDSGGDVEMLEIAAAGLLVVDPVKTDPTLLSEARRRGWLTHIVPSGG